MLMKVFCFFDGFIEYIKWVLLMCLVIFECMCYSVLVLYVNRLVSLCVYVDWFVVVVEGNFICEYKWVIE